MWSITAPLSAAQNTLTGIAFHLRKGAQFLYWREKVLDGTQQRKSLENLDHGSEGVERDEDI